MLNPATLLPSPGEGEQHHCVAILQQICTPCPDLPRPLTNPDLVVFVDESAYRKEQRGLRSVSHTIHLHIYNTLNMQQLLPCPPLLSLVSLPLLPQCLLLFLLYSLSPLNRTSASGSSAALRRRTVGSDQMTNLACPVIFSPFCQVDTCWIMCQKEK